MKDSNYRVRIKWEKIYFYSTYIFNSGFMDEIKERAGDTSGCMSDNDCALLYALVRYYKPLSCIESGTGRGKATSFIAKGMLDNGNDGTITSVERSIKIKVGEIIPDALKERVTFYSGDIKQFISTKVQQIDMFLHDSTHRRNSQLMEYNTFWEHLWEGGLLCSHDTEYSTAFAEFVISKYKMDSKGLTCFKDTEFGVWGNMGNFGFVTKRKN